ncbi:biotin--protein ligase [Sphingomonas sp. Leaf17]|nr:biotin--protein ligase [Sphingomonas sp. Leaf17]
MTVAETGSTNADVLSLAQAGAEDGLWLRAERQRSGRGRLGRDWASPVGNLYASTLVRLRADDPPAPTLALVAAVALEQAVSAVLNYDARSKLTLKWPNDLLLGGAKLSGILLERAGDAVVVGIGVNLGSHPDLPDRATTDLRSHGVSVTPADFLRMLAATFDRWREIWRGQGVTAVRARWLERAHPVGTALAARQPDGSVVEGAFEGLDPDGALILRLADGARHVIHAADVFAI